MTQAPTDSNIAPGTILAGKYRVARVLGRGGMGVVVEAHHIQLDDRVALKFLLPEYATHPEASERFLREARAAVKIKSEHVARVSDVGTLDTGAPYMVMEFLSGTDLSSLLEKSGPMLLPDAVDYVIQGCEAINEAHSYGIVHRDIKPANLFLTKRPDGSPLVKVLDFGISKTVGAGVDGLTKTTATMGSALYMSPEQMRQSRSVDHRTDIYSMGITLYELLAGKQPFYANTLPELCAEVLTGTPTPLRDVRNDLPPDFAAVLERAYARSLEQRFQSITEFVFALAPYAPARSQETLDRFARLANVQAPRAGQPTAQRGSQPQIGAYHQAYDPQAPTQQIQAGPYNAAIPHSQRSAAAFAAGPPVGSQTNAGASISATTGPQKSGGAAIGIAAGVLFLLVAGGGGGFYYMKARGAQATTTTQASGGDAKSGDTKTGDTKTGDTKSGADTAKTTDTGTAPPPPSATASAEPAAGSSATPTTSSSPSSTKPDKPTPTKPGEVTKPGKPTETAKPVETAKPAETAKAAASSKPPETYR